MPWGPGLGRQALLGEERPTQPGVARCCSGTRLQPPVCEPSPAPSPFSLDGHGERRDPTHGAVRALPGLRGLPGPARRCRRPSGSRAVLRHGRLRADGRRVGLHLLPQAPGPPRSPPGAGPRAVHDRLPSQVRSSPASQPASATLRAPPQAAGEGGSLARAARPSESRFTAEGGAPQPAGPFSSLGKRRPPNCCPAAGRLEPRCLRSLPLPI